MESIKSFEFREEGERENFLMYVFLNKDIIDDFLAIIHTKKVSLYKVNLKRVLEEQESAGFNQMFVDLPVCDSRFGKEVTSINIDEIVKVEIIQKIANGENMAKIKSEESSNFNFDEEEARDNALRFLFIIARNGDAPLLRIVKKEGSSVYCMFDPETFLSISEEGRTPEITFSPRGYPGASDPKISHIDVSDISELNIYQ